MAKKRRTELHEQVLAIGFHLVANEIRRDFIRRGKSPRNVGRHIGSALARRESPAYIRRAVSKLTKDGYPSLPPRSHGDYEAVVAARKRLGIE